MIVTHINGKSEFLTDYKSLQRRRRVNGEYSLSFLLLKTERNVHSYPLAVEESLIEYDGQQYRIKNMSEKTIGNTPVKQIQADHIFFDLVDEFQYDTISGYKSLMVCLNHALIGTGFTYSVIDTFPTVEFENFGNGNVLSLIQTCLERFGAEILIDGKHLTFKRQIGRVTDIQFRYKHNIRTIEKFVDTSNLSTYIKGFGAKDEDGSHLITAEYTSPMVEVYGIRHAQPIYDERYTTQEGLMERLQNDLQDIPNISYTLEAVELNKAGINTEQIELGDTIYTIYEPINIDINARIVEIIEYPEEPTSNQFTIANFRPNITDTVADFQRTKDRVDSLLEGKTKLPMSAMDEAIKRATIDLLEAETELNYENGGIYAIDPMDPNKLLIVTSTGIGISIDGGKTFKEAITANGFNLSAGVVGYLEANNIRANELSAITSFLGTVYAGYIEGSTFRTSQSAPYAVINPDGSLIMAAIDNSNGMSGISIDPQSFLSQPRINFFSKNTKGNFLNSAPDGIISLAGGSNGFLGFQSLNQLYFECNPEGSNDGVLFNTNIMRVDGDFNVTGAKNASVTTSIGNVNISAYETAEYYFGDIGRGEVVNGECTIEIESLFKETVNTNIDYEVFLTPYGNGVIYVDEMNLDYFVVRGDDIKFAYEIKAKRKGYETVRLELTHESEVV